MDSPEVVKRSSSMKDVNVIVKEGDLSSNRSAYKLDTQCSVCKGSSWTVFNPRQHCKFCYRCVCKPCSGQTLLHPEKKKEARCCSDCYRRFLSQNVIDDANSVKTANLADMKKLEADLKAATKERNITKAALSNVRGSIERLTQQFLFRQNSDDATVENLMHSIECLKTGISATEEDISARAALYSDTESHLKSTETTISTEKSFIAVYADKLSKTKTDLIDAQNEYDRLRRMMGERQIGLQQDNFDPKVPIPEKITELQGAINQLRQQQEALTMQNDALKREAEKGLEKVEEEKTSIISPLSRYYCELREQNEHLKREKNQLTATEYREREIAKLTRELDKLKSDNDELKVLIAKQQSTPVNSKKSHLIG